MIINKKYDDWSKNMMIDENNYWTIKSMIDKKYDN